MTKRKEEGVYDPDKDLYYEWLLDGCLYEDEREYVRIIMEDRP